MNARSLVRSVLLSVIVLTTFSTLSEGASSEGIKVSIPHIGLPLPILFRGTAFCTQTAGAALNACLLEVEADYLIAVGKCNNLPSADRRMKCMEAAEKALGESREECGDQFTARLEICDVLGEAPYHPVIKREEFLDKSGIIANPNPYFPLIPGTTYIYKGGDETITVSVTHETKKILGITTIVVRDTVKADSEVIEDTVDWYAQDIHGNVWYFGEISQQFENGELVSLAGSWKAGVEGAKPGIIMKANPRVGDLYRQEFMLGEAEDVAKVLSLTGSATTPASSCSHNCLVTRDFAPLEPGAIENKYYAPGIGFIQEVNPKTGEKVKLVEIQFN
jgi:hypothetical protein